jgi:phosphatidylserine/phosphatidylglycerophosphate/cardiolipin synthase-like enzyme
MYKYFQKFSKTIFILSTVLFTSMVFAETPHLDAVEDALRDLTPGSEGKVWERTQGNEIAGYGNWLLQSPNCWGDPSCSNPQGVKKLADTIYQDISQAQDWIDITTLVTFPDGIFQDAIVRGIKKAMDKNPDVTIRILGGTPPVLGSVNTQYSETAKNYLKRLKNDLGAYANDARVIVAGVETSWLYSWNHSKIIAVDGRTAIVGGHNLWEGAYGNPNTPVSDVSMHLRGPAAESAHNFADLLWDFADQWGNSLWSKMFYVEIAKGSGFSLWESFPKTHKVSAPRTYGNAEVLALGGLGFGMDVPGGTNGGLDPANDPNASCSATVKDYYNNDAA